jgi:hypothetical protein
MLTATTPSTRKPHGYLGAAVAHSCPATFANVSAILGNQDRPMEAGS